ncbi:MAG: hypothetical protein ACKOA9_10145 [Actinomycetota bacterium]
MSRGVASDPERSAPRPEGPGDPERPEGDAREQAAWFVWITWIGASLLAAAHTARDARSFPYSDDWNLTPVISGRRPLSVGFLLERGNEPPLVVPRLVVSTLAWVSGDFRLASVLCLGLLSITAAIGILTLRRVRGATALSDAVLPLALLPLTLSALSWGYHVHFVSTAVVGVLLLFVMTRFGLDVPVRWLAASAALLVVLLGEGPQGAALLPFLALWVVLAALHMRHDRPRPAGWFLGVLGVVLAVWVVLVIGSIGRPADPDLRATSLGGLVGDALRAATAPGGTQIHGFWPVTGLVMLAVLGSTVALLVVRWRGAGGDPDTRGRIVALACFGAALGTLLLSIGFGRGSASFVRGMENHYADLLVGLVCWIYVVWDRFGGELRARAGVVILAAVIGLYAPASATQWLRTAVTTNEAERAFRRDLCAGMPTRALVRTHIEYLDDDDENLATVGVAITEYQKRRFGPFAC